MEEYYVTDSKGNIIGSIKLNDETIARMAVGIGFSLVMNSIMAPEKKVVSFSLIRR